MEIKKLNFKEDTELIKSTLNLWREVFDSQTTYEHLIECTTDESDYNEYVIFAAVENGEVLGSVCYTASKNPSGYCCVGKVATAKAARGRGISGKLLSAACDYFDSVGGKAMFLGTNNPIAAHLYFKHGFSFITGTNAMVRINGGVQDLFGLLKTEFSGEVVKYEQVSHALKVMCIPVCLWRGRDTVMDSNANIISNRNFVQKSCEGLYGCFANIFRNGGQVRAARLANGNIAAICTVKQQDGAFNVDAFALPNYEYAIDELLRGVILDYNNLTATLYECDTNKIKQFEDVGFVKVGKTEYSFSEGSFKCIKMAVKK